MDTETVDTLLALNRRFYNDFAEPFSDSRGATEPGFDRIVAQFRPGDRVLDLGCGQGRLARLLPPACTYTGVDNAGAMLQIAAHATDGTHATFVAADLVKDRWETQVAGPFDWVVLRAVLHHIPGYDNRLSIVTHAAGLLAPQGRLVIANWQFLRIERLRKRLAPWPTVGLTENDIDAGDYLLDWQRQGRGLRYAHLIDEAETRRLAQEAGLAIEELFYADGRTNDLTLYAVVRKV